MLVCHPHTCGMTTGTGESRERANAAESEEVHYDIPADTFALRLVVVRHHAGRLSIEQAARECGLVPENWRRWEDGARPRDRIEVSQMISERLRIDLNWLMFGGPLAGPRGRRVVAKRPGDVTGGYPQTSVRPTANRPKVRTDRDRPLSPPVGGRRANRVSAVQLAEAVQRNVMRR